MKCEQAENRRSLIRSYSLRMLLLLTTLCCVALGIWRFAIRPYQLQEHAAKQIEKLGGSVHMVPSGSTWLASLVGKEHFNVVVEANLERHDDASEYIGHLSVLPQLETLRVGRNFTDAEMKQLSGCTKLKRLYFQHTQVTDKGFQVCKNFQGLRLLLLGRNITDEGMAVLRDKRSLAYVDLSYTQVTDEGLGHLRGLPALHKLRLNARPITDHGLDVIFSLPQLDELYLLGCSDISDEGFRKLADCVGLKQLEVSKTKISLETIDLLEESLTECRVLKDYRPQY